MIVHSDRSNSKYLVKTRPTWFSRKAMRAFVRMWVLHLKNAAHEIKNIDIKWETLYAAHVLEEKIQSSVRNRLSIGRNEQSTPKTCQFSLLRSPNAGAARQKVHILYTIIGKTFKTYSMKKCPGISESNLCFARFFRSRKVNLHTNRSCFNKSVIDYWG